MYMDSEVRKLTERHSPSSGKHVREGPISVEYAKTIGESDWNKTFEAPDRHGHRLRHTCLQRILGDADDRVSLISAFTAYCRNAFLLLWFFCRLR